MPARSNKHRPLRVLLLVDRARTVGGAERFVTGLAAHLPRERIEPWVCSTRQGHGRAVRQLAAAGVPHVELGRTHWWQLHRFVPLLSLLRRKRFDVLHANMFGSNVWGALIGRACRVPVVIAHEHGRPFADNRLRMWMDRHLIGRLVTSFVAVSGADRRRMIAREGVPAEKVVVMPLPHIPHQEPANGDIRSELGLDPSTPLVAAAAIMRPEKALEVMLGAHERLLERSPEAHLVIAGDGPCRHALEELIERLGLGRSVHLLGVRHDVDAILRAADVGVMSSDSEGMPLFVLECMAAGLPVVATAVGGVAEMVEPEVSGLLVPARDSAALAAALDRVLSDRALAQRLALSAGARRREFVIESVADRFAVLYEELMTANSRPAFPVLGRRRATVAAPTR